MRDYAKETKERVGWITSLLGDTGAKGIVFGNSGGKDSALVGILCRMATEEVLGVIMPCGSSQNYGSDKQHAEVLAQKFGIPCAVVDLTPAKAAMLPELEKVSDIKGMAASNINPRLRMATLYALAQSKGYLVAGTGNRSEYYTGYFTKWGDGAYDFNPIADLLATEVFDFLRHLGVPAEIVDKPPSAGLFEGQTDESEMGVSYASIDEYIRTGSTDVSGAATIQKLHAATSHKRRLPLMYGGG